MALYANPVRGPIHPPKQGPGTEYTGPYWTRPAGNTDFRVTQWQGYHPSPCGSDACTATVEPPYTNPITGKSYPYFHKGIDFGAGGTNPGADVLAMAPGKVTQRTVYASGLTRLLIDHGNGERTGYVHCPASSMIALGSIVKTGQKIAVVGNAGTQFQHLHATLERYMTRPSDGAKFWVPVDLWPQLLQNARLWFYSSGVNLRTGPNTTDPVYASTTSDGRIRRASDNADLGAWATQLPVVASPVFGGTYTISGVSGSIWRSFKLDGHTLFVAAPLCRMSAT